MINVLKGRSKQWALEETESMAQGLNITSWQFTCPSCQADRMFPLLYQFSKSLAL